MEAQVGLTQPDPTKLEIRKEQFLGVRIEKNCPQTTPLKKYLSFFLYIYLSLAFNCSLGKERQRELGKKSSLKKKVKDFCVVKWSGS